jgi:predicted dehydrogenase
MKRVRIGVLGAARIVPAAVIRPARNIPEASITVIAARDPERAAAFAQKHSVGKVAVNYAAVVEDPDVDAVYNPLPNGLHAEWTIAALEAGKHVLCEKPFAANSAEAEKVAATAERTGLVVMEAFHYRYHPLAERMQAIVASGELGTLRHVEASFCFPLPRFSDIRYRFDLAGGATMDAGCYAIHMARLLGGEEPVVVSATAKRHSPQVDRAMTAELAFPSGHTGRITCSLWSSDVLRLNAGASGDHGRLDVFNPLAPQTWHRLKVTGGGRKRIEHLGRRPTYEYQLEAFCAAVLRGESVLTPPTDSVANMKVIDAVYLAAGLQPRGT